jgi:ankyrin repeat protein
MIGSTMKEVIMMFVEKGRTTTALTEAARWGETEILIELLDSGLPVDARDENGGTALMKAASAGNRRIMRLLIDRGADVNAIHEKEGMTPLMWSLAALHGAASYCTLADMLLKAGARVGIKDREGRTALDIARTRNNPRLEQLLESAARLERDD